MKTPKPVLAFIALCKIFLSILGAFIIFPLLLGLGLINISVDKFNKWRKKKK